MKVELTKPLCSPEHNLPAGATVDLHKNMAQALIEAGAAKKPGDSKGAGKVVSEAAVKTARGAIMAQLKSDVAAVNDQLKKDKVKPGAKASELDATAAAEILNLEGRANEALEAL